MPCFLWTKCSTGMRWNVTILKKIETNKRRKAPSIPGCLTAVPDKLKNFNKVRVALTNKSNFGVNEHEIGIRKICHYPPLPKKNLIWGSYFKCPASETLLNIFLSERVVPAFLHCLSAQNRELQLQLTYFRGNKKNQRCSENKG